MSRLGNWAVVGIMVISGMGGAYCSTGTKEVQKWRRDIKIRIKFEYYKRRVKVGQAKGSKEDITGRCILVGQCFRELQVLWCGPKGTASREVEGMKPST